MRRFKKSQKKLINLKKKERYLWYDDLRFYISTLIEIFAWHGKLLFQNFDNS